MEEKIKQLEEKIDAIDKKIDYLLVLLTKNMDTSEKMSEHIDFVNNVYDSVKTPLHFISNKINSMLLTEN